MAVQQIEEPEKLQAVVTEVVDAGVLDVVGGGLLAVRVPSLEDLAAAVTTVSQRRTRSAFGPVHAHVRVHVYQ